MSRGPQDTELRRDLVARQITESWVSEAALLTLAAVVGALLWPVVGHGPLLAWIGAIVIATLVRAAVRRSFVPRLQSVVAMPWALRAAIIATGLAWGLGALLVAPGITLA